MVTDGAPDRAGNAWIPVDLTVRGRRFEADMHLPDGAVPQTDLLPALRALTDVITQLASHAEAHAGRTVACKAGCGHCCRQLVPVAPSEARDLLRLAESLPPPQRERIRARFGAVHAACEASGLLPALLTDEGMHDDAVSRAYFALGLPCPFLDNADRCSIHAQRPLICREYLVTSDPAHCRTFASPQTQRVAINLQPSLALRLLTPGAHVGRAPTSLPLSLLPTIAHGRADVLKAGPSLPAASHARAFLEALDAHDRAPAGPGAD